MKKEAIKHFYAEMKRRNVIKSTLAYLATSWILLQVLSIVLPIFGAPDYLLKWAFYLLAGLLPFWLLFSWEYEVTEEGLKRIKSIHLSDSITAQTAKSLDKMIIVTLGIAIILLVFNMVSPSLGTPMEATNSLGLVEEQHKSIAVLAFEDMSPGKDQEYFSDGISEEILNLLAKIQGIKVISRTSSFSFKGKETTTTEIGKILQVKYLLEGSVRKSSNMLRITAQLINVEDGAHLWSETYDREFDDIFKIQDEIAFKVTQQLKATLIDDAVKSVMANVEAYNLYLQAKQNYIQSSKEANINAEELLRQSIALDSNYAPAWVLLGRIYYQSGLNFQNRTASEAIALGIEAIEKSLELDPENALSYLYLAKLQNSNWDFKNSALNLQKAFELDPENVDVLSSSSSVGFPSIKKQISNLQKAIAIDPLDYSNYFNLGLVSYWNNDLEASKAALRTYMLHHPNTAVFHHVMCRVLLAEGLKEEALVEARNEQDDFFRLYGENFALFALGRTQEAEIALAEMIRLNPHEYANIADIYAFRGEVDTAFQYLQEAVNHKDPTLTEALYYPTFRILYKDTRWKAIQKQMGLPKNNGIPTT